MVVYRSDWGWKAGWEDRKLNGLTLPGRICPTIFKDGYVCTQYVIVATVWLDSQNLELKIRGWGFQNENKDRPALFH